MAGRPPVLTVRDMAALSAYARDVNAACEASPGGEDPFRLGALILRESGAGWAPGYFPLGDPNGWGDAGHGFGLCQIDRRFHADFLATPASKTVLGQLRYACALLYQDRRSLRITIKDVGLLERATFAAYNAGVRHVLIAGITPDAATTGGDYSAWVFKVADLLRARSPRFFVDYVDGVLI